MVDKLERKLSAACLLIFSDGGCVVSHCSSWRNRLDWRERDMAVLPLCWYDIEVVWMPERQEEQIQERYAVSPSRKHIAPVVYYKVIMAIYKGIQSVPAFVPYRAC